MAPHDADLRDPLYVQRPGAMRAGDFFASAIVEYAEAPLVELIRGDAGVLRRTPLVDDLAALQLSLGAAFHERLRIDLLAPIYATHLGPDGRRGPAMGDIRLGSMILLLPPESLARGGGGLGVGVVGFATLPSGDAARLLGRGQGTGGGKLAATWEFSRVTLTGDVGVESSPTLDRPDLPGGPAVLAGAGLGVLVRDASSVTLEVIARAPFTPSEGPNGGLASEAALSIRGRTPAGVGWTFGGALGLTEAAGVAGARGFFAVGFGRHGEPRLPDADIEGRFTNLDRCPLEPETRNGWKDDDGCPDELGALALDVRFRGRSWPAQVELVGKASAAAPEEASSLTIGAQGYTRDAIPGSRWRADARSADCLAGSGNLTVSEVASTLRIELEPVFDALVELNVRAPDGQPIPGATALWRSATAPHCVPGEAVPLPTGSLAQRVGAGQHAVSLTAEGYSAEEVEVTVEPGGRAAVDVTLRSARVRVEAKRIVIQEKVFFETGKARILPASFGLLDEVAATILTNPGLGRVEIAGHTDNQGSDSYNQRLSQQRAQSVADYLEGKGVSRQQLVPVGYGETRPIDTNRTESGREVNRRVEFNLLDQQGGTP